MKKILVTGASGFLGSRIVDFYKDRYHMLIPSHSEMDITGETSVFSYFENKKPDIVIHCAAISDTAACEKDPLLSQKVNVLGSENIARAAKYHSAKAILCSSDQVYCGCTHINPNTEDDPLNPSNVYGKDKAYTEELCLQIDPDSVHLRLAWMYDPIQVKSYSRNDFLKQVKTAIENHTSLALPINDRRGITDVWEVVTSVEKTFDLPGGVYNFGSPNDKSTYETVENIFQILNFDTSLLVEREYTTARNLTMSQSKLNQHGLFFSSTKESLLHHIKRIFS